MSLLFLKISGSLILLSLISLYIPLQLPLCNDIKNDKVTKYTLLFIIGMEFVIVGGGIIFLFFWKF